MDCNELEDLLHGYLDGELDLVRSLQMERHLEGCSSCAEALGQLKRLRQALQAPARSSKRLKPVHQTAHDAATEAQSDARRTPSSVSPSKSVPARMAHAISGGCSK